MSNKKAIMNIVGLMTTFHFKIKTLPNTLKCVECKLLLKDSYQLSCGCRFCRTCIDDVMTRGGKFCSGDSNECGETPLSTAVPDYRANKNILKLTAKCPHVGCPHECPLLDMESHMRVCSRKNIHCPFRELGCAQGALPGEEMSGHLLQENRSHEEILIGMVANISRDMEMLKLDLVLKDEQGRHFENEMKLIIDENKYIKEENKSIKDQIKTMKIENESIKREKEILSDRVRQLLEKLEQEIDERRQGDEWDSIRIRAVTEAVASNQDALSTEMEPIRNDIQSIRNQFDCIKGQIETIQVAVGLEQLDDWLIEEDVAKTEWGWFNAMKTSGKFGVGERTHAYELASVNSGSGGELRIFLRIWAGPSDSLLQWPFRGVVTVTVGHRDRREACSRRTRQCRIMRPPDNGFSESDYFNFPHVALRGGGLDLEHGVRVLCQIVPGAGQ